MAFAAGFVQCRRNAVTLAELAARVLGRPVEARELRGEWLRIPESETFRLGRSTAHGHPPLLDGRSALGERVWDCHSGVEIVIGPLDLNSYCQLIPPTPLAKALASVLKSYAGPEYDFTYRVVLRGAEIPQAKLGGPLGDPGAIRLGWQGWLAGSSAKQDFRGAVFRYRAGTALASDGIEEP